MVCYNILLIFYLLSLCYPYSIIHIIQNLKALVITHCELFIMYLQFSCLAEECGSDKITGTFSNETDTNVTFTFMGGHPDLTYECKIGNSDFEDCK